MTESLNDPPGDPAISERTPEKSASNSSGLSIASLALGIVALAVFWWAEVAAGSGVQVAQIVVYLVAAMAGVILGVIAVVTGVIARRRVKRGNAARGGVALAGIVLGVLAVVIPAIVLADLAYVQYSGYEQFELCVKRAGTAYPNYLCLKECPSLLDSLCRRAIGW
ncbi:MAG TPA: DUF4190 domain-containing protein [Mycobacterium sp.]|nr:DUF4190 domain-containing protein [Mycobacterium sp.]